MNSNSPARLYGLIGYPVKHSFSPAMHNAAFKKLNIPGQYHLFEKTPQELDYFLESLDNENIYGLNVTVPYKERVLNFIELDSESFYLKQVKAVNTIVRKDNIWKGFNTDIPGFSRHLKELGLDLINKRVALMGAGGAAKAVSYVLAKAGAKEIAIFDIDKNKSESIISMIKKIEGVSFELKISPVNSIEELHIQDKDLLINATPVGLKEEDPCLVKETMLHKDLFIYDLIYNPAETKLLSLAKKVGAKYSNGLGMLLYQGALSFKHFTNPDVPIHKIVDIMREALKKEIEKR